MSLTKTPHVEIQINTPALQVPTVSPLDAKLINILLHRQEVASTPAPVNEMETTWALLAGFVPSLVDDDNWVKYTPIKL